ncbi:MAG: 2-O-(6-phospho-alpha-D-mannosyl)-D-glycerate hydrolase [Actinomycetota bacterium]|nr:2-O-(6-phospho-alpha-D-mannosyl)-D-glycerate hydrolase [Actinomycetota bacterium]
MPRTVAIVPHTHWDREWYEPFQTFRMRLVTLLDELLPMLEQDLSYARFLLDGQTIVVDDYLEVRPEALPALQRLSASGRISVGPWMVLMDEFMVSGETIVRDLQLGIARGSQLGGVMPVGYLPDMFGHVAQMPQLLRLANLENSVLWRGVPRAIDRNAFWWEAPDGSRVRVEWLFGSYSNGANIPPDAKKLIELAQDYEAELGDARLGDLLLMNGTDHQMPSAWLGRVVAEANDIQDDYHFVVTSLPEYLPTQPIDGLPTWRGELRSGWKAHILMGVASNRVDVHQLCAQSERSIERRAEPLAALLLDPAAYPHRLLDIAWNLLVANSAHDSSCACSADEVVEQVRVRYAEARQIGDGVVRDAVHRFAAKIDALPTSTVVVNPTARARSHVVEVTLPGRGPLHFVGPDDLARPSQLVDESRRDTVTTIVEGEKVRWVLHNLRNAEEAGVKMARLDLHDEGDVHYVEVEHAVLGEPGVETAAFFDQVVEWGQRGDRVHFKIVCAPIRTVLFDTDEVDGFGWRTFRPVEGAGPAGPVAATEAGLGNEHLRVAIDGNEGTYAITTNDGLELRGLGRLVDGGDGGDTYSYSPPAVDVVIDRPEHVDVSIVERGPLRARALITATYSWPAYAIGDEQSCSARSDERVSAIVRTTLELRAGEGFLRVHQEIDNPSRDHRVRAHFPLPALVRGSDAECAFTVVHRDLTAEGGPQEFGLPTFPSRRFVDASDGTSGLALLHDGLLEYEVVDDGRELALTLLRATGYISRSEPSLRPTPAGPYIQVEGAQMLGRQRLDYAVLPHRGDWRAADLYRAADAFLVPFECTRAGSIFGGSLPVEGSWLRVDGAEVSAVRREPGGLVVRVFRTDATGGDVTIERDGAPVTGWVVDLVGAPLEPFEGRVRLEPWQIATLRLDE